MTRYLLYHCQQDRLFFLPGQVAAVVAGKGKLDLAAGQVDTAGGLCSADFWIGETGSWATGESKLKAAGFSDTIHHRHRFVCFLIFLSWFVIGHVVSGVFIVTTIFCAVKPCFAYITIQAPENRGFMPGGATPIAFFLRIFGSRQASWRVLSLCLWRWS